MNWLTRKLADNPIENCRCAAPPFGCGESVDKDNDFIDSLSYDEYMISGLCQSCQDKVFVPDPDDIQEQYEDDRETFEQNQIAADGYDG